MKILKVENLSKIYGKGDAKVIALNDISFEVEEGEYLIDAVANEKLDLFERDKRYLFAINILSKCKMLVAGRTSGTVATMVMSEGFKEIYLWDRGRYGDELEKILKY